MGSLRTTAIQQRIAVSFWLAMGALLCLTQRVNPAEPQMPLACE